MNQIIRLTPKIPLNLLPHPPPPKKIWHYIPSCLLRAWEFHFKETVIFSVVIKCGPRCYPFLYFCSYHLIHKKDWNNGSGVMLRSLTAKGEFCPLGFARLFHGIDTGLPWCSLAPGGYDKWLHINCYFCLKKRMHFCNLWEEELAPVMCHSNSLRYLEFITAGTQRALSGKAQLLPFTHSISSLEFPVVC